MTTESPAASPYEPPSESLLAAKPSTDLNTAPTRVRYTVLTFLCVLAFIFYVDRICISKAATAIEHDLHLSDTGMGIIFAAFTVAYSLFEVPTGWLGDRYGSRGVLTRIVVWWSFFTALTGAAMGFYSLIAIRFLFGVGEAGAFPNTARVLGQWFPDHERGFTQGLINTTALLGGAASPALATYLIDQIGWRGAFIAFSTPGVIWAIVFYRWFRDEPREHPRTNAAEQKLIELGKKPKAKGASHPRIPWGLVFQHPSIWLLGAVLACMAFNAYFYFSWYPRYLENGRLLDNYSSGWLASLVLFGAALGSATGGWIADWLVRRASNRKWSRRLLGAFALTSGASLLLIAVHSDNAVMASVWTTLAMFVTYLALASWWGAVTDISGRHLGALFGLMNSLGGLGAITSQLFVGYFVDYMKDLGYSGRAQWDPIFYVYAGVLFAGAIGWLLIDASHCVDTDESGNLPLSTQDLANA